MLSEYKKTSNMLDSKHKLMYLLRELNIKGADKIEKHAYFAFLCYVADNISSKAW